MANEWKNEKKKENRGVALFLLIVSGIGLTMLLSKLVGMYIGKPNYFIQVYPFIIIITSYFIWNRKGIYVFIALFSILYCISLYDLSNPSIKESIIEFIDNYKYQKYNGRVTTPNKEVSTTNGVNVRNDCTSLELSNTEHCDCIDFFEEELVDINSESIQDKIRYLQKFFHRDMKIAVSEKEKMGVFLRFGKKMLEYDNLLSEKYLKQGLSISESLKDNEHSMLFRYYLGVLGYLSYDYDKSKAYFNEIIKESVNDDMRMIAFHGLLQIKKNNYELLSQKDLNSIRKKIEIAHKKGNKTFELLFKILEGDMFVQKAFYQRARDIYSETNGMLLNKKIDNLSTEIYRRLGYTYKTKGAFERSFYYRNKGKKSIGRLREEGDVMDFFVADAIIEKGTSLNYSFRLLKDFKEEDVLIKSFLTLHYASQELCNNDKYTNEITQTLNSVFIKPNIKRRVLFNISRYYELIGNEETALSFAKKVSYYNNNLREKIEYHQYLGELNFYKLKNIKRAIFHAKKLLDYCSISPKGLEYIELFKKEGRIDKNALSKVYFILGEDNIGRKSFVYRNTITSKRIEALGLLSDIYYSLYLESKDDEYFNELVDYLEKLINAIESLSICTVCEVDKKELSIIYYNWLDLYVRIGKINIGLISDDESIDERLKQMKTDEMYRKIYFAMELAKINSTLFGLSKNYVSFLHEKSRFFSNLSGGINNINEKIFSGKYTLNQIDSLKEEKYKILSKKERHLSQTDTMASKSTLGDNGGVYTIFDGSKLQMVRIYENKLFNLFHLMSNLRGDEMFLNYYHSQITNQLFVMVIGNDKMKIMSKDLTHDVDTLEQGVIREESWYPTECNMCYVNTFKKFVEKEAMKYKLNYSDVGKKMYDMFFPELYKEVKRVYISNHGITNYLPFEVFLTEYTDNQNYSELPYLFKKNEIVYVTSGTFLYGLKEEKDLEVKAKLLNIAPFEKKENNMDTIHFERLTSSKKVIEYFDEKKNVLSLLGDKASINNVKEKISSFNVLHFSTHGKINTEKPMDSQLLMYPDTTLKEDKLHLYELFTIKLKAKLAVLAACETGENILTNTGSSNNFINAFHYAGCPTVIGTQWKVNDTSTGEILVYFYEFLEEGKTVSGALRSAKLKYLEQDRRDGEYHPYYWAGLIVSGNPDMKISFD